jgi:hypothetical protein
MQLQILHFIKFLEPAKSKGTLEQKGVFFSALLNRHPQRARKHFSSINNLIYSPHKAEARNIRKDLSRVKELFELRGLKKEAKEAKEAINKINEKHFREDL